MKLEQALDEYGLAERRRHRGERGRQVATALSALREFLLEYSGFADSQEVRPQDLMQFLLEYYPAEEEPVPEVALALLEVCSGFAVWLMERGERTLAPFAAQAEQLRADLPRVLGALDCLQQYAHRDDLAAPIEAELWEEAESRHGEAGEPEDGEDGEAGEDREARAARAESRQAALATLSSGAERVARLDQIDYPSAQQDYYEIERVDESFLVLRSPVRSALGEGPAEPVPVPAAAAELLRTGDIIHAEIAPGPAGWELLEVFGIRPGSSG